MYTQFHHLGSYHLTTFGCSCSRGQLLYPLLCPADQDSVSDPRLVRTLYFVQLQLSCMRSELLRRELAAGFKALAQNCKVK